jgi:hypothetical protein
MKFNHADLKGFLIGNILGDGSLKQGTFATAQITKDLVEYKRKVFTRLLNTEVKVTYKEARGMHKEHWALYCYSNEYLKKQCEKLCKPNENKTAWRVAVTEDILEKLTPLGIAIWFADDGTTILVGKTKGIIKSRRVQFCTDRYSHDEVLIIKEYLSKKYGKASLVKRGQLYRVQLNLESAYKMFDDILPFFFEFPSLLYKLDLGYSDKECPIYNKIKTHPQFIDRLSDDIV